MQATCLQIVSEDVFEKNLVYFFQINNDGLRFVFRDLHRFFTQINKN